MDISHQCNTKSQNWHIAASTTCTVHTTRKFTSSTWNYDYSDVYSVCQLLLWWLHVLQLVLFARSCIRCNESTAILFWGSTCGFGDLNGNRWQYTTTRLRKLYCACSKDIDTWFCRTYSLPSCEDFTSYKASSVPTCNETWNFEIVHLRFIH